MDFNFETMVDNEYMQLEHLNLDVKNESLILPTIITEIGPTRMHWKNVKEYLKVIQRHPDHFIEFLRYELPGKSIDWFSASKSDGLIIHGKGQRKTTLTDMALKYVNMFVICPSCKKVDTNLKKVGASKYEFECTICGFTKNIC